MKRETIAWCENCWMHGRTTWVERSDGTYECIICHQIKRLSGMKHEKTNRRNTRSEEPSRQDIAAPAD